MFCAHCMSTSPSLLVRLKIDLLMLRETNCELKEHVEGILEYGLGQVEGTKNSIHKIGDNYDSSVEGEILGKRLLKLDLLRFQKKNNRVKYRTSQLLNRVNGKRRTIESLKRELARHSGLTSHGKTGEASGNDTEIILEKKQQLLQIQKVLSNAQVRKLRSLMEWYVIRKRDSYEVPYSLAFQPVISLKNFYKLPPSIAWRSMLKMSQYLSLISEILLFKLPFKFDCEPNLIELESGGASKDHEEGICDDANVAEYLAKLVINVLQLSRHLNLLSKDPIDLAWMLDQYDLDTLFYNLVIVREMKGRPVSHHWTYTRVLAVVSEALQLSVYATSPASRQALAGTIVSNSDRWSLVG